MKPELLSDKHIESIIKKIKAIVAAAKDKMAANVNLELLQTYWQIGKIIAEQRQKDQVSNRNFILQLSRKTTTELGQIVVYKPQWLA